MNERFRFRDEVGGLYALPPTTRPAGSWGLGYDLSPAVGTHATEFHLEGTGGPVPGALSLVIPLDEATEAQTMALMAVIVGKARAAVALERDGSPDRGILSLQSYSYAPADAESGNSARQDLTLNLIPAAPDQVVLRAVTPPTGTPPTYTVTTSTIYIDNRPVVVETLEPTP